MDLWTPPLGAFEGNNGFELEDKQSVFTKMQSCCNCKPTHTWCGSTKPSGLPSPPVKPLRALGNLGVCSSFLIWCDLNVWRQCKRWFVFSSSVYSSCHPVPSHPHPPAQQSWPLLAASTLWLPIKTTLRVSWPCVGIGQALHSPVDSRKAYRRFTEHQCPFISPGVYWTESEVSKDRINPLQPNFQPLSRNASVSVCKIGWPVFI